MRVIVETVVVGYRRHFSERGFQKSFVFSGLLFICSLFVNFYAIYFATQHASNSVTDIILSNTPVFQVDDPLIYGTIIFAVFTIILLLLTPRRIPFALYALALFYLIRSVFTMLTHMAPFESFYVSDWSPAITNAFYGGDLFFSGHTGMPFLGALVFWRMPWIRNLFLFASLYFAAVVLLGHLHYSIDVLAAFFITYGIYHIALFAFPREHEWFMLEK